jgi:tetratricopeptide (TPR) repeat protein
LNTDHNTSSPLDPAEWMCGLPDFHFAECIGSGGMGDVYLAASKATGRRFAAKVCHPRTDYQKAFFRELTLWIDLPEHPNLAPCYFFRSVGESVIIFADFYEAGSLEEWIVQRRLSKVSDAVRISLMMARGLAFLHDLGFVHRDFKPRNVLMSLDGVPKVADFGVAAALAHLVDPQSGPPTISAATLAYRSPEQADLLPLTPATDVWSWAVTVLHLFAGHVVWLDGAVADRSLTRYLRGAFPGFLAIPARLAALLQQCLIRSLSERIADMRSVVAELKTILDECGEEPPATVVPNIPQGSLPLQASSGTGGTVDWFSPTWWNALLATYDQDIGQLYHPVYVATGSRTARALADLIAFEEIRPELERRAGNNPELRGHLAAFYSQLASVRIALGDESAAAPFFELALETALAMPADQEGRTADLILSIYMAKALDLEMRAGSDQATLAFADGVQWLGCSSNRELTSRFRALYGFHLGRRGDPEGAAKAFSRAMVDLRAAKLTGWRRASALARIVEIQAEILSQWGAKADAARLLRHAVRIHRSFVAIARDPFDSESHSTDSDAHGRPDRREVLARLCSARSGRGNALNSLGRPEEGIPDLLDAVRDLSWLVKVGESQTAFELSSTYGVLATAYLRNEDWDKALATYEDARRHLERLVVEQGREQLTQALARIYLNVKSALTNRRDTTPAQLRSAHDKAIPLIDRAVQLLEFRIQKSPSRSLYHDLARAYADLGLSQIALGYGEQALRTFDRSRKVYAQLQELPGSADVDGDLAYVNCHRAHALLTMGRVRESLDELHRVVPILTAEARRTGRIDLQQYLDAVRELFGDRDWGHESA